MERQKDKLTEYYEAKKCGSVQEIEDCVKKLFTDKFTDKVWLYAVMDDAVVFGIYENGSFMIHPHNAVDLVPLEWDYIQELRIFNRTGELRLVPLEGQWVGRYRGCLNDAEITSKSHSKGDSKTVSKSQQEYNVDEYDVDEYQKIWGEVKRSQTVGSTCWSQLRSERGTCIWIPVEMERQQKAAIRVRKFMRIPKADDKELVYQTDIRMVDFCRWDSDDDKEGDQIG